MCSIALEEVREHNFSLLLNDINISINVNLSYYNNERHKNSFSLGRKHKDHNLIWDLLSCYDSCLPVQKYHESYQLDFIFSQYKSITFIFHKYVYSQSN